MTIGAIVLAAGLARRMGRSKLDLLLDGKPVLAHVLERLADAGLPVIVVTGGHADAVRQVAGAATIVHAPEYAEGLGASLRSGIAAVPPGWTGVLVVLGDMPHVKPDTFRTLAAALESGKPAVVPVQDGRWGNPAGFARMHFATLATLVGDAGARAVLRRIGPAEILVQDAGVHRDIDCMSDLAGEASQ